MQMTGDLILSHLQRDELNNTKCAEQNVMYKSGDVYLRYEGSLS